MIEWAKVYTDMLGDPKLMRAARLGAKGLDLTPWFIVFAKEAQDGGRLTINGEPAEPIDFVPLTPGQTLRTIGRSLGELEALKVLVRDPDGALRFSAWEMRQDRAPSDTPEARRERVRRHRERKKQAVTGNSQPVTNETGEVVTDVTDVTVTDVTISREEESKTESKSTSPSPPPRGAERLRGALPEQYRADLDALLARVSDPAAWCGELSMAVEGGTAGAAISYADLGQAIHDFRLNGKAEVPEIALFRRYVQRAAADRRQPARTGAPRPAANGQNRSQVPAAAATTTLRRLL